MATSKRPDEHTRSKGTVLVTASGFPSKQWKEWNEDCKENYGDCRWVKMWSDHLNTQNSELYDSLLKKYRELEDRLFALESGDKAKQEPVSGSVETLGGIVKERD